MTQDNKKPFTADELRQFTGSETYYRHGLARNVLYTEGAKYLADRAGAYWLLDIVALYQNVAAVQEQEFQVWTLKVGPDRLGAISCEDGNGKEVFQYIVPYTDFPLDEIKLWCGIDGAADGQTVRVIYLPSEH